MECAVCQQPFDDLRSPANRAARPKRFCSRACKQKERILNGKAAAATARHLIKRKYGISQDEYRALRDRQGGACAICGTTTPIGKLPHHDREAFWLHVDHDHKTGQIRGLLCTKCNIGLGQFKDDPLLLQTALRYLSLPPVGQLDEQSMEYTAQLAGRYKREKALRDQASSPGA
jgi:hypothetical protein